MSPSHTSPPTDVDEGEDIEYESTPQVVAQGPHSEDGSKDSSNEVE